MDYCYGVVDWVYVRELARVRQYLAYARGLVWHVVIYRKMI